MGCGYFPDAADNLYLPAEVNPDEVRLKEGNVSSDSNGVFHVPFIYYKGYAAENEDTGKQYTAEKNSQRYLDVKIGKDTGNMIVYYRGTKLQKISNVISLVSACLLFLYMAVWAGKSLRLRV